MNIETHIETRNQTTQPIGPLPVFNNPGVVALGWYYVCPAREVKLLQAKSFEICGHQLVIFRGDDHKLRALDAYCPHMGTHLGVGKVVGTQIRCFFHHWKFNERGDCTEIPCQREIPVRAKLKPYSVIEKYDSIWIYPNENEDRPLADFDELMGHELLTVFGKSYTRTCHHHVTMINGIDPQHLKTVHNLNIEMDLEISEQHGGRQIDITLSGKIPDVTVKEKIAQFLLGANYGYSMRYDHASAGFLTLMKNVSLFGGSLKLPTLHMIFAYRPLNREATFVQPIFITKKRSGLLGFLFSRFLIFLTQRGFYALQGEDGMVYENMRFYPQNLLPIDRPVAKFIQYVNKLPLSPWRLR